MHQHKSVRILLVEDLEGEARLLTEMLQKNYRGSIEIVHVADLQTTLQALASSDFDLILLDLTLPDSHGFATFAAVNAVAPDKAIVVMTGLDDQKMALRAMQHGAEDFLIKSKCPADLLCRAVCYAVERKRSREELRRHRDHLDELVNERTAELQQVNSKLKAESQRRQQLEEERLKTMKLESLSLLAGGIAHDFNNILTAIHGNIALVQFDVDANSQAGICLSEAEKACRRAKTLTQQLLTFSKGGAPMRRTAALAESVRESAEFVLRGSNVKCNFMIADDLLPAHVDIGQISQVMQNLVINAKQAMPAGGCIWISATNIEVGAGTMLPLAAGNYVCIEVRDSGNGIGASNIGKIFDPYFTTKPKGSGLGLAICHSIISKHNGYICAANATDGGAMFTIYLPADAKAVIESVPEPETPTPGNARILVMDDEEAICNLIATVLQRRGYHVTCAADGAQAIELFAAAEAEAAPFDLVILDLTVPGGMGGKEALAELQKFATPVRALVSSGYCNDPVLADYRKYGFHGAVLKPFAIADLALAVADVLT